LSNKKIPKSLKDK